MGGEPRVFLGGPFKSLVDSNGVMRRDERSRFEALIAGLEQAGYHVDNAHRRESWGAAFLSPEECTRRDFDEIKASDVVVAFPGSPPSPGTHIEIGWASALGKPLVLLLEADTDYAFLVRGLHTVAAVVYLELSPGHDPTQPVVTAVLEASHRTRSASP